MFHKDTLRLIKHTFNRFFSLFMMVLIGVAFMMGLFSTKSIMKESVDAFNDEYSLQDVQLYSSYGFDDDDVKEIKKQPVVDKVFASKTVDCYCRGEKGSSAVARVEEIERNVNGIQLVDGRMPQKEDEILLLYASVYPSVYPIGSRIHLYLEKDDLSESLAVTEYTIVGFVQSPAYISKALGSSNLDNMELDLVLYVPSSNFLQDYYTTVSLTLDGASEYISYTDEYDAYAEDKLRDIENFAAVQQEFRKAKIKDEYEEELEKGEAEFEEKKAEGQKQLDDAKKQLDDANVKIIMGELQIDSNQTTLDASRQKLEESEKLLNEKQKILDDAVAQVEEADEGGRSFDEIYDQVSAMYNVYVMLKTVKTTYPETEEDISVARLEEENASINARIEENNSEIAQLESELSSLDPGSPSYASESARINSRISVLRADNADLQTQYDNNERAIAYLRAAGLGGYSGNIQDIMDGIDEAAGGSIEDTYAQINALKEARDKLDEGRQQLEDGKAQIRDGQQQLDDARYTLAVSKEEYEKGLKDYEKGLYDFEIEIEKAESELKKARQDLEDLPDASWMILDRKSHYSSYMYRSSADQMGTIGTAMPILFFLVAALVSMTTMTRLIDEQRGQIGIFRALGFSNGAIVSKYAIYSLLASLSGSVFGVAAGMAIFPTVIYNTWRLMYLLPPMKIIIKLPILLICVFSFSLLLVSISTMVVMKTLKEMPSQLMRPKAPKSAKPVFLEKIHPLWNRLSFTSKITARNIIRYKMRFFMTVIGVAGCTSLLVLGWGIKDSIGDIINVQFGRIFAYDYTINIEDDRNIDEFVDVLEENMDNRYVVPVMTYMTKLYGGKNDDQTMTAYVVDARDAAGVLGLKDPVGKTDIYLGNGGVIVSQKFADTNKIKKGDTITIESKLGVKAQVVVSDICEMYFQHYVFISDVYYRNTFGENVHPTEIAVSTTDGETMVKDARGIEGFVSAVDFSALINTFQNMINALDYIILVIIITAGALAFVVLINLTQVNISERLREIATLKVLGFRDGEVNSYLFKEIFLLSVIGGFLGMPLGVLEHHFIMGIISMDMVRFGNNIYPMSFIYAYVITIVFTLIVLQLTKKPLRQIQMVESLKSVE
ncbi:MAG: ABC transporter permease [Firmicutes bacterium]|nr:ABC transporter permease [Bacillota bacterium]